MSILRLFSDQELNDEIARCEAEIRAYRGELRRRRDVADLAALKVRRTVRNERLNLVLDAIDAGETDEVIGQRAGLSPATIRGYRYRYYTDAEPAEGAE